MNPDNLRQYERLKRSLPLDQLRIDEEIMELPMLMQEAAELAASLREEERTAIHDYEIAKSEAAQRLRSTTDEKGKAPSEASISSRLNAEVDVQNARRDVEQTKYDADVATALASNLHEKRYTLLKFADMMLAGFITPTSINRDERAALAEQKRARARLNRED